MREQKICSWIHHIATFLGIFIGTKQLLEKRGGIIRKGILGLFLGSQLFAVCKILADMIVGRNGIEEACEKMEAVCSTPNQRRGMLAGVMALSVLFKVGSPYIIMRPHS